MVDLNKMSRAFYWHPEHAPSLERVESFARQVAEAVFSAVEEQFDLMDTEDPVNKLTMDAKTYLALKREICGEELDSGSKIV